MKVLYINACARVNSRTNTLAQHILSKFDCKIEEVTLEKENIKYLDKNSLDKRDKYIMERDFNHDMFKYAKSLIDSDIIVISTPYWDLSFPASLKSYIENINVVGLTFKYNENNMPYSLIKAKKLYYVTTSGGKILNDEVGFGYIKMVFEAFYGIKDFKYFKAEELDIYPDKVESILNDTKKIIDEAF